MKTRIAPSLFPAGTLVRLVPEWSNGDATLYSVVNGDESKGRCDISPVEWSHGALKPLEVVRVYMIERASAS